MHLNKEIIKNFYESLENQSQNLANFFKDDVDWTVMDGMPSGGRYVGVRSILEEYFPNMLSNFKEFEPHPEEFLEIDDNIIVFGRYTGESNLGKKFDVPFCHSYKMKDNKISQFKLFTDTKIIQNTL